MKKILIALSVLLVMSGCDGDTKNLSCNSTSTANGITTNTKYEVKYKDDRATYVKITYDYTQDNTNNNNDDVDGTNADTDGITSDKNKTNNGNTNSDDVVDGVVGDAIDGAVDAVTDTILDLSGIRDTYQNQMSAYDNIEGFKYTIDTDTNNEYKVIYEIDMDKISDSDLTRFDIDKNITTFRTNQEDLGYTCK